MTFQGALVTEQGITFAIVVVKSHVIQSDAAAREALRGFRPLFPGAPIILMAQDYRGTPTYYGRPDIVRFLANVPVANIPWREYQAA